MVVGVQVLIKPIDNSSPINFRSGSRIPNCWIKLPQTQCWLRNSVVGPFCATEPSSVQITPSPGRRSNRISVELLLVQHGQEKKEKLIDKLLQ